MTLITVFLLTILPSIPGKISPGLHRIMDQAAPLVKITVIVHMNTEYPLETMTGLAPSERGMVMRDIALNSQQDIVQDILGLPVEKAVMGGHYWIFNGFHLTATRDVVETLALRDDIWFICENGVVRLPMEEPGDLTFAAAEWNIQKVMADSCWQAGYSGDAVILGFVDTGCMTTHEALNGKWLSPYWLDAVNGQTTPYDDNGHGTAVAGIACGGDGPGPVVNDIGVAYGAKIIPTKAFSSGGGGSYASIDSCLQYLVNLRTSGVAIRAVNNSWGTSTATDLHWWPIMLNMKSVGILPATAVGSSGPGPGTVCAPANYPTVIACGATDASDNIASFSSRGPAPDQNPWNDSIYWYYHSWDLLKPDVSAPGVSIRTSYNNGGYINMSGASFAIPHATGGVALFCEKDSMLSVADLYYLFRAYCDEPSQGAPYPNMNYGWGRINLWRGLQALNGVEEDETEPTLDIRLCLKIFPTITHDRLKIAYHIGKRSATQLGGLKICDVSGRLVKDLSSLVSRPSSLVIWDGTDEAGRNVAPGVYFVKLYADGEETFQKAVLLH